ncbi:CDP-diacylglycerol--glycerol-3-phosphate 3-phosphatidyltransferase [Mycoplasmoides genitalium]|nr:CDP-diacylglycerol--glycerol-3-phosphate 3-phosphatidyltransferase [Mycoplasmoides genitalium]
MLFPFPVYMAPLTSKFAAYKKKIANWLTVYRIFIALPTIIFIALDNQLGVLANFSVGAISISLQISLLIGGFLFLTAVISDYLDGYLARKWLAVSNFGKLWDPIADKVIINGVLIALAINGYFHFSLLIVFIVRDLVLDGMRIYAYEKKVVIAANWLGKWKTIMQMVGIVFSCFVWSFKQSEIASLNSGLFFWLLTQLPYYLAAVFSIWSFIVYNIQIYQQLKAYNSKL